MRKCAKRYGKDNFFLPGEITGGNTFASIFLGRGRQPNQLPEEMTQAVTLEQNKTNDKYYIRDKEHGALDAGAFHYTVYRTLLRFLGLDGNLAAGYDAPLNWIDQWNTYLMTNDLVNINTGEFDPRHLYGVSNFDVFRWPAIYRGIERQLLGHFVTSLLMPGAPLVMWGEEQAYYVLDNTDSNYIFGRQPMSSATAWQTHGCYHLDSTQFYQMPWESARHGCSDDGVSLDHRDPSAPVRNIIRHMLKLRDQFPVLRDGFFLQQLSNQTKEIQYPGSSGVPTETGMWSVMRSELRGIQNLTGTEKEFARIWLLYSNLNETKDWQFDCGDDRQDLNSTALIAPFVGGTTVKNLFYPFDEQSLADSTQVLGLSPYFPNKPQGCLNSLTMKPYDYRAYVPIDYWVGPEPMITKFSPGHDARILSKVAADQTEDIPVELQFSEEMDCDSVTNSISFTSSSNTGVLPKLNMSSIVCGTPKEAQNTTLVGGIQSVWSWSASVIDVGNGIHALTVDHPETAAGNSTKSRDKFLFRVGQGNNPMIFPRTANYSTTLLTRMHNGNLLLNNSAAGADMYRYSTNFASTFSEWKPYVGGMVEVEQQPWSGTSLQAWKGEHVRVEYFSRLAGSSDHVQHADLDFDYQRRLPHIFLNGPFNSYGYDAGLNNEMKLTDHHEWSLAWMVEWSPNGSVVQANVWGMNPDGQPDQTWVFGDVDGDSVLDHMPPSALAPPVLNITMPPPLPYLSWRFIINDGDMRFRLLPAGSMWTQIVLYALLWALPIVFAALSAWLFAQSFYKVKFNKIGITIKSGWVPISITRPFRKLLSPYKLVSQEDDEEEIEWGDTAEVESVYTKFKRQSQRFLHLGAGIEMVSKISYSLTPLVLAALPSTPSPASMHRRTPLLSLANLAL